jgi:diaminohydroxyphosphoribosylaminopyrimidine deaminase/5-amino-6-(5-phosphoribosylamino)uracil reductase
MQDHEKYMRRCFDLALLGRGNVSPNPKVGAVIVYQDQIIGEGYHKKYGQSHAEVNAIASVENKNLLKESTIYVNLEPCCHWGKTPPCTNLIIENKIKRCVICNKDINPKVFGGGMKLLQDNGVEVISGVLEEEGLYLNRRFFTNQSQKRPYVILKFAQTLDGFISPEGKGGWISNDTMKVWVHKQRTEEDAIMVGYNTVLS